MSHSEVFVVGEEPESELHRHGSVLSARLSAGQRRRAELHAQTQGQLLVQYEAEI